MGLEIERKFLPRDDGWRAGPPGERLVQGYLSRDPARTVRVRIAGERAFLTIKGPTLGASRAEFEYPVPPADAQAMLALCDGPVIDKIRHLREHGGLLWEVDEFLGDNRGLVVAEVELASEDQRFEPPPWLGSEVTGDVRYYNAHLSVHPFTRW